MHDISRRAAAGLAAMCYLFGSPASAQALSADCIIDPSQIIDLASPTGGILSEIHVNEGERVAAGETVAQLSSEVEEATVRLLAMRAADTSGIAVEQSRLTFLEDRLVRSNQLNEKGVISLEVVEEVRTEVATARSLLAKAEHAQNLAEEELKRAEAVLSRLTIRSPIDGVVARKARDVGEYLAPEDTVLTIVRLDPLEVMAFLPVSQYRQVAIGDAAIVRPTSPVEGEFSAEVIRIDRVFDVASGTFRITLSLSNPDFSVPGGHRCRLEIVKKP